MYPHYPTDNPNRFGFLTNNGIPYVVEFSDASDYFSPISSLYHHIEGISFNPVGDKNGKDENIAPTIADIIKSRCIAKNTAVVYVCDQSGDKSRSKLFKFWNLMFNDGSFHFLSATIEYQTGKLYTGLIIEAQNPNAQSYLNDFRNTMLDLQTKFN